MGAVRRVPDATVVALDGEPPRRLTASQAARLAGATGSRRRSGRPAPAPTRPAATPSGGAAVRPDSADQRSADVPVPLSASRAAAEPVAPQGVRTDLLDFVRRRLAGDYEVDETGFDAELTDRVLAAPLRPLYRRWFRVDALGMDHVPDSGGALVVANHSGTVAVDAVMTQLALLDHHPARRNLRMLGADLVFSLPIIGSYARKAGHTLASPADAQRLLGGGELVGVWPEGFKGIGKPFSQRYRLQRFGRGGFVAAALRARVPIIPTAIVGAEEIYPMLGNSPTLARLLGLPYFPLTPTFPWLGPLGLIPLPSKWFIEFGEPIPTDGYPDGAADDPMLVFNLTDHVRQTIQESIYRLLRRRRTVFG
ncbi:MAG: acyltransferase family protein [Actinomycetota bacterium]|nr:MAG: acyltransferase family protein [Actinomycetota bacterium]